MQADLRTHPNPDLALLDSEALERRLGELIRRYVHRRSTVLASAIVHHVESLCRHPDFDGDPGQRCVYHRLARHWDWLARTDSRRADPG